MGKQARSGKRTVKVGDLAGLSEIADRAGVTRQRISELSREPGFPAPLTRLKMGPVWNEPEVLRWLDTRRRQHAGTSRTRRRPTAASKRRVAG